MTPGAPPAHPFRLAVGVECAQCLALSRLDQFRRTHTCPACGTADPARPASAVGDDLARQVLTLRGALGSAQLAVTALEPPDTPPVAAAPAAPLEPPDAATVRADRGLLAFYHFAVGHRQVLPQCPVCLPPAGGTP